MFISPFWGYSLQKGSRVIAIIDLVIGVLVTSYMLRALITGYLETSEPTKLIESGSGSQNETEIEPIASKPVGKYMYENWQRIAVIPIYIGVECWLFRLLYKASKNRNIMSLNSWLRGRAIVLISSHVTLFNVTTGGYETVEFFLNCLLHVLYMMVEIDVVVAFKRELDTVKKQETPNQYETV